MTSARDRDLELWKKWDRTRSPMDLEALLKQVDPIIHKTLQPLQGPVPSSVLSAEAKLQALKAFQTFQPGRGNQLSTHLTNYLRKVNRLVYKHQELYSVPEARRIKFHTFNTMKTNLQDQYDRDPTVEELASNLKWSNAEVGRFIKEDRKEFSDSQPYSNDFHINSDPNYSMLAYVYNDLAPKDKLLLEHTTGYGGKRILNNSQLMRKFNMTQGQLSYAKKQLTDKIDKAMGG